MPKTVFLGFFLHWSPYLFPWPLQSMSTPCHLHFSKPSSHLVFPKLSNRPPSHGIPSACGVGSSTHAQHTLLTSCPLFQQAPFMLAAPQPPCLCSLLAPMLGNQQGMLRPLPAYLNPPNSSKTSSRPSPLCAAS